MISTLTPREQAPTYLYQNPQTEAILNTLVRAGLRLQTALADTFAQLWVDSATWGLAYWEEELGLTASGSIADRLASVKKAICGGGANTLARMETIAGHLVGIPAVIEEDSAHYAISLWYLGLREQVSNLDTEAVVATLQTLIPAHLALSVDGRERVYQQSVQPFCGMASAGEGGIV